jgi:hypothetical protein
MLIREPIGPTGEMLWEELKAQVTGFFLDLLWRFLAAAPHYPYNVLIAYFIFECLLSFVAF